MGVLGTTVERQLSVNRTLLALAILLVAGVLAGCASDPNAAPSMTPDEEKKINEKRFGEEGEKKRPAGPG